MDNNWKNTLVWGERVGDLGPAFKIFGESLTIDADGSYRYHARMSAEVAAPWERAMLRAEASLLIEDADHMVVPSAGDRTPDQRRADALFLVVQGIGDAIPKSAGKSPSRHGRRSPGR